MVESLNFTRFLGSCMYMDVLCMELFDAVSRSLIWIRKSVGSSKLETRALIL